MGSELEIEVSLPKACCEFAEDSNSDANVFYLRHHAFSGAINWRPAAPSKPTRVQI